MGAGIYLPVDKKIVKDATLRLNVDNLFDKEYLDGVYTTKTNAGTYSGFRDGDPASIVTREGGSVLEALGDETLWHALSEIGIQGIHNGPLKLSGGLQGRERTPSIDGNFDRISFGIDP
ncbi:glycosidase, putative, partial [Pseudomonas syringae pv. japonica str. M301072]